MKKISLLIFIILTIFAFGGCEKKSGLEGKIINGQGKPMANVKIIAKQVQPIKGYEQFEAVTGSDGIFYFKKLFPTSEYVLFPLFDDWSFVPQRTLQYEANKLTTHLNKEGWITEDKLNVESGPEGQTLILKTPIAILPTASILEGKMVDGKNKPIANVKIIAKQKHPVPGYEHFEAVTDSDGIFHFKKLFPFSKYTIIPISDLWETVFIITTHGECKKLKDKFTVRWTLKNGVVTDSLTGLMWAAHENGENINWFDAKSYCKKYKGGGFSDWRLPTLIELGSLYKAGIRCKKKNTINISCNNLYWASNSRNSNGAQQSAYFIFTNGSWDWCRDPYPYRTPYRNRALPVRSSK